MKRILQFFLPSHPRIPETSWEVEYLVQQFLKQSVPYPEPQIRAAVQYVLQHTVVPRPGDGLVKEVLERLQPELRQGPEGMNQRD